MADSEINSELKHRKTWMVGICWRFPFGSNSMFSGVNLLFVFGKGTV